MVNEFYLKYREQFLNGDIYKCKAYFEKNAYYVEAAYCELVLGHLDKAYKIFDKYAEENTRASWGKFLLQMIYNKVFITPKYFEIRNFLEIDINILLTYKKYNFVEKILAFANYMSRFNPETCKYIGRVLWANGYIKEAVMFLENGKKILYKDPELHYLLAYIYHNNYKDDEKTLKALNAALEILPEYFPANRLKSDILKKVQS